MAFDKISNFNVLAITACLKRCSIAIAYDGELFEVNEYIDAPKNLVFLTDELIKSKGVDLRRINGVITVSGPGSFTGIRTAQSLTKGIAFSMKIPAASVSYFDVIQHIYLNASPEKLQMTATTKREAKLLLIVIRDEGDRLFYSLRGFRQKPLEERSSKLSPQDNDDYREISAGTATVNSVINLLKSTAVDSVLDGGPLPAIDITGDISSNLADQAEDQMSSLSQSRLHLTPLSPDDFMRAKHLTSMGYAITDAFPVRQLFFIPCHAECKPSNVNI
jgi:tRNA A37 threonylcarbamoyladenosine modification protein TsaB